MLNSAVIRRLALPSLILAFTEFAGPTHGQVMVQVDGGRGTSDRVSMSPGFESESVSWTRTFEQFRNTDASSFETSLGRYDWSVDHFSTLTPSRLCAEGSVGARITFESEGVASASIHSYFGAAFELSRPTWMRLRLTIDTAGNTGQPRHGSMRAYGYIEFEPNYSIFVEHRNGNPGDIFIDEAVLLPAGTHVIEVGVAISGTDYYALEAFSGDSAFTAVLAVADCPGDLDGNGSVGMQDLAELLSRFGSNVACSDTADVNLDGAVDLADLIELLGEYGTSCAG